MGKARNFRLKEATAGGGDASSEPKGVRQNPRQVQRNHGVAYVQILGTGMDTQDTVPSVLLFFEEQRYIFNAGEGLQRFCTEHKIKISKIHHICLTRVCSETAGGLPGLLLTLAGMDEKPSVNIWGPQDLKLLVEAMKSFVPHAAVVKADSSSDHIENEVVKISRIPLQPNFVEGSEVKLGDVSMIYVCELPQIMGTFDREKAGALGVKDVKKFSVLQNNQSVKSDCSNTLVHPGDVMDPPTPGPILFIVDCPTNSHAQELLSMQSLNDYFSENSNELPQSAKTVNCIIHLSPASVVCCPSYQKWMKKFSSAEHIMAGYALKHLGVPILKSSAKVATQLNYLCPQLFPALALQCWNHNNAPPGPITSSKGHVLKLCESTCSENLLKFTLRPPTKRGLDKSGVPCVVSPSEVISELLSGNPDIVDAAKVISHFWCQHRGIEEGVNLIQDSRVISTEPMLDWDTVPSCLENIKRNDLEIVFLGTGSSQPSKYRNVSSIFINLFSRGSLLLDCGEGTMAQLKRRYGIEGADNAVRNLRCVWISHIHADHHAGLARILALRCVLLQGVPHEPLLVIAPKQLKKYLNAYQQLEDLDMQFVDCRSTNAASWEAFCGDPQTNESHIFPGRSINGELPAADGNTTEGTASTSFVGSNYLQGCSKRRKLSDPVGDGDNGGYDGNSGHDDEDDGDGDHDDDGSNDDADNDAETAAEGAFPLLKRILSETGLERLVSFPVKHCAEAYGVVLEAAERVNRVGKVIPGWKVVYSGDTKPCSQVIEASRGATLLIHEATFEDGMAKEAKAKRHSTTKQAIEVGDSASVYRIILTHFSQRYPKIPALDEMSTTQKACVAFDLMTVNIADLPLLPFVLPYLRLLFKDEMVNY